MIKKKFKKMWYSAKLHNNENILNLLEINSECKLCDLGCDNGEWTFKLAKKIETKNIFGVEITKNRRELAEKKGIIVKSCDLNKAISFEDNFFDVIHANQVIEHLYNTGDFIKEIYRILKHGGYAIISTENASSWHNIFALCMGWQMFSLTNIDFRKGSIGNPLAIHRNDECGAENDDGKRLNIKSWEHVRIFSYLGLKEIFEVYGFTIDKILGSGYYPLPWWFAMIDPRHCHFITIKVRKI